MWISAGCSPAPSTWSSQQKTSHNQHPPQPTQESTPQAPSFSRVSFFLTRSIFRCKRYRRSFSGRLFFSTFWWSTNMCLSFLIVFWFSLFVLKHFCCTIPRGGSAPETFACQAFEATSCSSSSLFRVCPVRHVQFHFRIWTCIECAYLQKYFYEKIKPQFPVGHGGEYRTRDRMFWGRLVMENQTPIFHLRYRKNDG